MAVTTPHFAYPFAMANGQVNVVEQDTTDELMACAYYLLLCPTKFLHSRPDFGWDFPEFRSIPLDVSGLLQAMERYAPVARYSAQELSRVLDITVRTITLQMQQVTQ